MVILEPEWLVARRCSQSDAPAAPGHPEHLTSTLSLFELFEALAERQPDAIAFDDGVEPLSYRSLLRASVPVAARLMAEGSDAGPVALLLPPDARYAVALLGGMAAGRCCLLLDPGHPDQRNEKLIVQSGATQVVTAAEAERQAWPGAHTVALARALDDDRALATVRPAPVSLDAPAFIIATSGSTGEPKLVVHSQRTIWNRVRATHDAQELTADDRMLTLAVPAALSGLTGLLAALSGASVQVFDMKQAGLGGLLEVLATRPITLLRGAPSMLRVLAQLPEAADAFSRLRIVVSFGEPLTRADAAMLFAAMPPGCRLRTSYGSTEANGFGWFVDGARTDDPIRIASGSLMPDAMAAVIGDDGRSCPPGEAGELWMRSRYTAIGEWIGGALQPGRLEPHPSGDGSRVYRTGDLARYDEDGIFVVLGRKDRMLKINGQRVEPSEVEAALRSFPEVKLAEVIVQQGDAKTSLIACVVPWGPADAALTSQLRAKLRTRLPPFMMPSRILILEAIPLLPNGKVDAMALGRLAAGQSAATQPVLQAVAG